MQLAPSDLRQSKQPHESSRSDLVSGDRILPYVEPFSYLLEPGFILAFPR